MGLFSANGAERLVYFLLTFFMGCACIVVKVLFSEGITGMILSRLFGADAVFRLSFALLLFYIILAVLVMMASPPVARSIQEGHWCFKLLTLLGLVVLSVCIPNKFYSGYAWVSMFLSGIFLFCSIVYLIDFGYDWSISWVYNDEEDGTTRYRIGLIVLSVLGYLSGIVAMILFFNYLDFTWTSAYVHTILVGLSSLVLLLVTLNTAHGAIFPACIVFIYQTFLLFSAFTDLKGHDGDGVGKQLMSAGFCIISLAYTSVSVSSSTSTEAIGLSKSDEEEQARAYSYPVFNAVMCLAAAYLAMLITNWGTVNESGTLVAAGTASAAAKLICVYATGLLYLWTLVAPSLFPDRVFDYAQHA